VMHVRSSLKIPFAHRSVSMLKDKVVKNGRSDNLE
jgi:hypothetical protein